MSSRDGGTNPPESKPKGFTKFKRRVSRILGKDDAKRASVAGSSAATAASSAPASTPAPTKTEPPSAVAAETAAPVTTAPSKPITISIGPKVAMTAAESAKIQEEKVRAMFAKYNMTLDPGEWTATFKADIPRVEKKIRVRIHRTCHRCQTQYGVDRICSNCNHPRCRKCPRYPAQRKEAKGKEPQAGTAGYVKKPATQRTRKICHKCQTPFKSKTAQCENCQHERCAQCVREPPKAAKTPGGATEPSPPSRIKWTCHECNNVHRDPENPCLKCGHNKCDQCGKDIIRQPQDATGEGDMKEVEKRMKSMGVSPQASAA